MMRFLFFVLIFLPSLSNADAGIDLFFQHKNVTQGSLQSVEMTLDVETLSKLEANKLLGTTISDTLYIVDISPFIKKETVYKASATVIFVKIPTQENGELETVKGKIKFNWGGVEVLPTEISENFLFGSFEIPKGRNLLIFLVLLVGFFLLLIPVIKIYKKRKKYRAYKNELMKLKKEITDAQNYGDIVNVWKRKHDLLNAFPKMKDSFQKFEKVLFQVQFKPIQSDLEKEGVVNAYKLFLNEIKGDIIGI